MEKNYMAQVATNRNLEESYENFFNYSPETDSKIDTLSNELKKIKKELEAKENELSESYAKKYREKYQPARISTICKYTNRSNDKFYYLMPSGQSIDYELYKDRTHILIDLYTKAGYVSCVDGYAFDIGGIIAKNYKYNISQDNSRMSVNLQTEQVVPFFAQYERTYDDKQYYTNSKYIENNSDILRKVNGTEFLNTMFGVSKKFDNDLNFYRNRYRSNKAFETIVKTAPDVLISKLLSEDATECKPIYQLVGCTKETYNKAEAEGLLVELFEIAEFMQTEVPDKYNKELKVNLKSIFNMTENDWLEMIKTVKGYEEDLNFYGIATYYYMYGSKFFSPKRDCNNTKLLTYLANNYLTYDVYKNNYSFRKFVKYVIEETINQGYSGVDHFLEELRDYLEMCKRNLTIPCLYSSMLKLTHDIASRNHRVTVSPEDETKFQEKYVDFKDITLKLEDLEYHVVAPKNTNEIKKEGDNLSHCVASYIKRIIDGESLILFLRKDVKNSLITLELKGNVITQARGASNRQPNEEEIQVIKKFADKQKLEIAY